MEGMLNAFKSGLLGGILAGLTNLVPNSRAALVRHLIICRYPANLPSTLPLSIFSFYPTTPPYHQTHYILPDP